MTTSTRHQSATSVGPVLSLQQRVWIALYSLDAGHRDRAAVLAQNNVTEADLAEFEESWLEMRCRLQEG